MTTGRKYFSGNTLEIAVMQAARHHGLQPEEVAYRKIDKRHGFLKTRKSVVIEVDPNSPQTSPDEVPAAEDTRGFEGHVAEAAGVAPEEETMSPSPAVAEQEAGGAELAATIEEEEPVSEPESAPKQVAELSDEEELPEVSTEEMMEAARRGLKDIMSFAKLELDIQVTEGEDQLEIELSGTDRERLVEDRGNLLLAIQHLLPRLIRGYTGRSIPCHVDSEEFHAGREIELRKLAEEAAKEVQDRQRPRTLPPMNPAERRIIHVTLADIKEIATESQGRGFFKRVTISPARGL
jgi:spoIIIJ-associated protein